MRIVARGSLEAGAQNTKAPKHQRNLIWGEHDETPSTLCIHVPDATTARAENERKLKENIWR